MPRPPAPLAAPDAAPTVLSVGELVFDPKNARRHTPRNIGMIADGLQKVGFGRSVLIDENNVLLAGNGVIEAASEVGITRVRVIEADGNTIIAVRRSDLTEAQKLHIALLDNRASELSEWNPAVIEELMNAPEQPLADFFYEDELQELCALAADERAQAEADALDDEGLDLSHAGRILPVAHVRLEFFTKEDADVWRDFQTVLNRTYPAAPTVSDQIVLFLEARLPAWFAEQAADTDTLTD